MLGLGSGEKRASLVSALRRSRGKGSVVSVNGLERLAPEPRGPALDCWYPVSYQQVPPS